MNWQRGLGPTVRCVGLLMLTLLSNCQSGSAPVPALSREQYCAGWNPIYPDTGETKRLTPFLRDQIFEHDLHGQDRCGWKP